MVNAHPYLCLDWWAYNETADETFRTGARRMLGLAVRDIVLDDGSTIELIDYDIKSGEKLRHYTLLGVHNNSCCSRGQTWSVAGFLRAWEELGDPRYLQIGRKTLNYRTSQCDETCVPPWDFKDPKLETDRATVLLDTSASAIVAA